MTTHKDFSEVPLGLFLIRMNHESTGGPILHIRIKINNGEWFNQPFTPVYSEDVTSATCPEFWAWAKDNLPVWEYPNLVKAALP